MTSDAPPEAPRLTTGQALATIAGLLVLSLVVPPTLATSVAAARVERARVELAEIATALGARRAGVGEASSAIVLAGRGRLPKTSVAATGTWLSASRGSLTSQPDPWGNAFLARTRGPSPDGRSGTAASDDHGFRLPLVVLSAGPNGVIETAFDQPAGASAFGGDDVGVRIRVP
jgi:hypothetical protein